MCYYNQRDHSSYHQLFFFFFFSNNIFSTQSTEQTKPYRCVSKQCFGNRAGALWIEKNGAYVNSTNWERLNYSESTSNRQAFSSRVLHYIWEKGMILFFFEQKKIKDSCLYWIFNIELLKISLWKKEYPNLAAYFFFFFFSECYSKHVFCFIFFRSMSSRPKGKHKTKKETEFCYE